MVVGGGVPGNDTSCEDADDDVARCEYEALVDDEFVGSNAKPRVSNADMTWPLARNGTRI
jgi:hypothetical protein